MRSIRLPVLVLLLIVQSATAQILPRLRRHEGVSNIPISYGQNVANAGDITLDGIDDYIVASPDETIGNPSPPQYRGVVRVYSGATGAVIHTIQGPSNFGHFGWSIGGGGDVNADGVPDIIVGLGSGANPSASNVSVYSGATGQVIWAVNVGYLYGYRVANAGDVNGDGYDDVITSSGAFALPTNNLVQPVKVLSGANAATLWSVTGGAAAYDSFGLSVGGAVDLDLDGNADFLVGWSSFGGIGSQSGAVVAFSGATGLQIRLFASAPVFSFIGMNIAVMGDLDGDQIPEIMTGGYGDPTISVPGIVRVYSGGTGAIVYSITGPTILGDGFGVALASGADLNGDGVFDFVTSTPDINASGPPTPIAYCHGVVRAFSGANGAQIGVISGIAPGNNIGSSLAMLRDTNGDGFGEILCGSPRDETAIGTDGGSAEILSFFGSGNYLAGNGTLQLVHVNGAPGTLADGLILAFGAAPGSAGVIAADIAPANTVSGTPQFPLYLAATPALVQVSILYDASGGWGLGVNLHNPAIAGTAIFAQAFELTAGGIISSQGLQLLFGM